MAHQLPSAAPYVSRSPPASPKGSTLETDLQPHKVRIVNHMNEDHTDSALAYVKHYNKMEHAVSARLTDLSAKGLTLDVTKKCGTVESGIFVPYSRPLANPGELRKVVVEMHHECYAELGFAYRITSGYTWTEAKNKFKGLLKDQKAQVLVGLTAVVVAGVGAGTFLRARRTPALPASKL